MLPAGDKVKVELQLIEFTNKLLLLHLVGCLYCWPKELFSIITETCTHVVKFPTSRCEMKAPGCYFNFIMIYDLHQVLTAKPWQAPQDVKFESVSENVDVLSTYENQAEIITEGKFIPVVTIQLYEGMESELCSLLDSKLESFL